MAAVKLESENNEYARAKKLLTRARDSAPTCRVYMKSAKLEWGLDNREEALRLVDGGLKLFNDETAEKLWLMKTQLELELGRRHDARSAFQAGVKKCTQCIPLWCAYADFELKEGQVLTPHQAYLSTKMRKIEVLNSWVKFSY